MKLINVLIGMLILISSCKKETNYEFWIGLNNMTNEEIQVAVFPKSEFINGYKYQISTYNDYSDMEFTINPNESEYLFYSNNLEQEPEMLLKEIFDSVIIVIELDSTVIIKFLPESVENYEENMYSENSIWKFTLKEGTEKTNLSSTPFEIHDYQFEIKEEKIK